MTTLHACSPAHGECGEDTATIFADIVGNLRRGARRLASTSGQQESTQQLYAAVNQSLTVTARHVFAADVALKALPVLRDRLEQSLVANVGEQSNTSSSTNCTDDEQIASIRQMDDPLISFDSMTKQGSLEQVSTSTVILLCCIVQYDATQVSCHDNMT